MDIRSISAFLGGREDCRDKEIGAVLGATEVNEICSPKERNYVGVETDAFACPSTP